MKIRTGFVSNSSSTSFVVTVEDGSHILRDTYEVISFIQKNPEKDIMIIGPSISDGHDIFVPDKTMKESIISNKSLLFSHYPGWVGLIDYSILEDEHPLDEISGRYYDIDSFVCPFDTKKGTIFLTLSKDDHSCESVMDLRKEYYED